VLVVNTASACGYTRANFEGLVATRRKYGPHGFEVLSFPSNSFRQEPLDGPELERWARDTHGAEFPVFAKGPVVGPDAQPVWRWIREQQQAKAGGGKQGGGDVKDVVTWNFWKFLVDGRTGQVVRAYGMPYSAPEIEHDVYALLNGGADGGEGGGGGKDAGGDTGATAEKERTAGAAAD
jgi:glutathione peroxidase